MPTVCQQAPPPGLSIFTELYSNLLSSEFQRGDNDEDDGHFDEIHIQLLLISNIPIETLGYESIPPPLTVRANKTFC